MTKTVFAKFVAFRACVYTLTELCFGSSFRQFLREINSENGRFNQKLDVIATMYRKRDFRGE